MADELGGAAKYAHVERERRWRVDPARRPAVDPAAATLIEDRYIAGTRLRLRRMTARDVVALKLTKKYDVADPVARPIVTAYLDAAEYDVFAALPAAVLTKRRFAVEAFSLDLFDGALAGLSLVETEADDAATLAIVVPPAWAGDEVTFDPRYAGAVPAAAGWPET